MKLKQVMISLIVAVAAGCDTVEQDADFQPGVNTQPAYMLPNGTGFIDLPARIKSPGITRVEITSTTTNGELLDLGKGLLQYTPLKGSKGDSFRFKVYSPNGSVSIDDNQIDIIISSDTTNLPCAYVYTRNDSVHNVSGPVLVDVLANDYACNDSLTVSVNVAAEHGNATVVGNKILYTPGVSFTGTDQLLYKATSADPSVIPGYGLLRLFRGGLDSCTTARVHNDLFFKPLNDTTLSYLNVLANDTLCTDSSILITRHPRSGVAFVDDNQKKIGYKDYQNLNFDDTLFYKVGSSGVARVIIKRQ